LTTDQKQAVQGMMEHLREWCGQQARCNNRAAAINHEYTSEASAVLDLLETTDEIPNDQAGQYGGSVNMTKAEIVSTIAHIQGILASYDSAGHRQLWVKGCGPGGLLG
jgi:hypothetical protein